MSGWSVKVVTRAMSPGGQSQKDVYLAGTSDQKCAEKIVKEFIDDPDKSVTATKEVSDEVLKKWGVKPGGVKLLPGFRDR